MKKLVLLIAVLAVFAGCAKKETNMTFSDVKTTYGKKDLTMFCMKNTGNTPLVAWVGLQKKVKEDWQTCVSDLQSSSSSDTKNVDRPMALNGSICESWDLAHTIKTQKLKVPGKYRLVFTFFDAGEAKQKEKTSVKTLYSEPFEIK